MKSLRSIAKKSLPYLLPLLLVIVTVVAFG